MLEKSFKKAVVQSHFSISKKQQHRALLMVATLIPCYREGLSSGIRPILCIRASSKLGSKHFKMGDSININTS